ncbi:acetyl-CoA carboxylase biotin carboxyl carrier protein subunit [Salsuginibacillus kocurii]|uniref:acetyl-CoA carboxylase biotin carboxyl carrier protein subunit n=1 Tax=Salsuginibacillus kocurii TaxID=427078 RepID=UPI000381B2E8|nr:acetyl-CoA carboxylase biotin carboxyl carrier protein subunit [Salsuginibacillus kocurii]
MATIYASMAGNICKVLAGKGESVKSGEEVVILESMKMEIPITAEAGGTVKKLHKQEGDFVDEGDPLMDIE